jgi:hypothetical protein
MQRRSKGNARVTTSMERAIARGALIDGNLARAEAPLMRAIAAAREGHWSSASTRRAV